MPKSLPCISLPLISCHPTLTRRRSGCKLSWTIYFTATLRRATVGLQTCRPRRPEL